MMHSSNLLSDNLTRLLGGQSANSDSSDVANGMPLVRSHGPTGFDKIAQKRTDISSKRKRQISLQYGSDYCEGKLGTENCVFFYVGSFRYPHTEVGFLFMPEFEDAYKAQADVSPFDSGALIKHLNWTSCPSVDDQNRSEGAKEFLNQHRLPVPEYRKYLAIILDNCFATPLDYLDGSPYAIDQHGLSCIRPDAEQHERRWTFELRIDVSAQGELPMPCKGLSALFIRENLGLANSDVHDFIVDCKKQGVAIKRFKVVGNDPSSYFNVMREECVKYVKETLEQRSKGEPA